MHVFGLLLAMTLASLAAIVHAGFGVDTSGPPIPLETVQCLLDRTKTDDKQTYNHIVVRLADPATRMYDQNATQTIKNALQAGIRYKIDGYVELCPLKFDVYETILNIYAELDKAGIATSISTVWYTVEQHIDQNSGVDECWQYDNQGDVNFNIDGLNRATLNSGYSHFRIGIRTDKNAWQKLANNDDGFSQLPLWWANNGSASLTDQWQPFGGWSAPTLRQFSTQVQRCRRTVNLNYGEGYLCAEQNAACGDNNSPCCAFGYSANARLQCSANNTCQPIDSASNHCTVDSNCNAPYEKCSRSTQKCVGVEGQPCFSASVSCIDDGCKKLREYKMPADVPGTCCQQAQCANSSAPAYFDCNVYCAGLFGSNSGKCADDGRHCACDGGGGDVPEDLPAWAARMARCDSCAGNDYRIVCHNCCLGGESGSTLAGTRMIAKRFN